MPLYRALLVDDEAEIRDGIRRKIDWEANGFMLVGCAENGQEALEMAMALHPDVVMTDIKMPFMDGLTLCARLCESMPAVKLVIFSGFDDFEYAQRAIQSHVTEYILKPVNASELTALLQKLRRALDEEIAEKRNVQLLREHYLNSLPMLREQFYSRLLDGRLSQEEIWAQAAAYGVDLTGNCWAVALLRGESVAPEGGENSLGGQRELIPLSLMRLVREHLTHPFYIKAFPMGELLAVIASYESPGQTLELIERLSLCCSVARRHLELAATAGVGAACQSLHMLHYSFEGARTALQYRALLGPGRAIYIGDVEPDPGASLQFEEADEQALLSAIKLGTPEDIRRAVGQVLGKLRASRLPLGEYQLYFMELVSGLLKVVRAYKLDTAEVFGRDFYGSLRLSRFDSLDGLAAWFDGICLRVSDLIRRERTNSAQELSGKAKAFIAENYADPNMSVEMLCAHLHVSPAYFSTVFKRETGKSFVAHLTAARMEEAVKLLGTTAMKTYEISLAVGYTEPNYFSYVFKKQFGMSPTRYRAGKQEGA